MAGSGYEDMRAPHDTEAPAVEPNGLAFSSGEPPNHTCWGQTHPMARHHADDDRYLKRLPGKSAGQTDYLRVPSHHASNDDDRIAASPSRSRFYILSRIIGRTGMASGEINWIILFPSCSQTWLAGSQFSLAGFRAGARESVKILNQEAGAVSSSLTKKPRLE